MNKALKIFCTGLILCICIAQNVNGQAQDTTLVDRLMNEGVRELQTGNYYDADLIFRKILGLNTIIPDEFTYYYGETLLALKKYKLSESFFEKYIKLTDSSGEFMDQTEASLIIVKAKLAEIEDCDDCDDDGFVVTLEDCHICSGDGKLSGPCGRCDGRGEEICPTCLGEGIEVLRTSFGRRYVPCSTCQEKGYITCQKCQGTKIEHHLCDACKGVGKLETKKRKVH